MSTDIQILVDKKKCLTEALLKLKTEKLIWLKIGPCPFN